MTNFPFLQSVWRAGFGFAKVWLRLFDKLNSIGSCGKLRNTLYKCVRWTHQTRSLADPIECNCTSDLTATREQRRFGQTGASFLQLPPAASKAPETRSNETIPLNWRLELFDARTIVCSQRWPKYSKPAKY